MRVFVTGAAGRVGRVLVAQLVASGHAVSGLVSDQGKAEALRAAGAEPVVGRLEDAAALDRGVADAEVVYHLAGGVRGAGSVTADALNHQGTRRLVEAIQRRPDAGRGLASLLFSSTTAIYGDRSGLWVDEQMAPFPQTLYGASKVAAEALLSRAAREDGLPVRIARLAAVYGPDFPFLMADRMAKGKAWLPGEGRNYVPVIHVEDAAAALVAVAERGPPHRGRTACAVLVHLGAELRPILDRRHQRARGRAARSTSPPDTRCAAHVYRFVPHESHAPRGRARLPVAVPRLQGRARGHFLRPVALDLSAPLLYRCLSHSSPLEALGMLALLALTLTGCAPQHAEMTGEWISWLAANSSATVAEGKLDLSEAATIDCLREEGERGYIGNSDENFDCAAVEDLEYFTELQDDGYYVLKGDIEPWRTEAIVHEEGYFQLTTHTRLGNGQDFRFVFSIDPNFAPVECLDDGSGNPTIEYVDDARWLDEWSVDEDGHTIYYLQAGAYQANPGDSTELWFFDRDWASGFASAKFAAEELAGTPPAYGWDPPTGSYDNFLGVSHSSVNDGEDPDMDAYADEVVRVTDLTTEWATELNTLYDATIDGEPIFSYKIEDNMWRPVDGTQVGIDGWVEAHSSWVRIADDSDLTPGGTATGDFQILYTGLESGSFLLIRGEFTVNRILFDKWGYPNLEDDKREENETPFCSGAAFPS